MSRILPLGAALILVALLAPGLVPQVVAQQDAVSANVAISIPDPGTAIVPGRLFVYGFRVTYTWGSGAAVNEPIRVTIKLIDSPSWGNVTFKPDAFTVDLVPPNGLQNGSAVVVGSINLTTRDDAPAFLRQNITLEVSATGGGNVRTPPSQKSTLPVQPDFKGGLVLEADTLIVRGGTEHVIPYRIRNTGNGPVDVTFATTSLLAQARVTAPAPIHLGSPAMPGSAPSEAIVDVRVTTPWTQSLNGTVTLTATATSSQNTQKPPVVEAREVTVLSASALPAPPAPLIVLALIALALASRRRAR